MTSLFVKDVGMNCIHARVWAFLVSFFFVCINSTPHLCQDLFLLMLFELYYFNLDWSSSIFVS